MITLRPIERRTLLVWLSALGVAGLMKPLLSRPAPGFAAADTTLDRALADLLPNRASAAAIGRRYLERTPEEDDVRVLARLVLPPDAAGTERTAGPNEDAFRKAFETMIRQDFAEGRLADVDGWQLSLSEARLCALVALRQPA